MGLNKCGFTLMELIVVVCLIGIISGFAGSGLIRWIPDIALKSAANELVADMRLARSLAVKNQETVSMGFDPATNSYKISSNTNLYKTVNLNSCRGGIRFGTGAAKMKATQTPAPFSEESDFISLSFGRNRVDFSQDGMAMGMGYIYLCNENNAISYATGLTSMAGVVTLKKSGGSGPWITL